MLQTKERCVHSLEKKDTWRIWDGTMPGNEWWEKGWRGREEEWRRYPEVTILLWKGFKLGSDRFTSVF